MLAALAEKHARGEETKGELKREREAKRKEDRAAKRVKTLAL